MLFTLHNPTKERAIYVPGGGALRGDGIAMMTIPSNFAGDTVEAYLAFVSEDYSEASDSDYLGSIAVPVGP